MPIWGFNIEKTDNQLMPLVNTYYTDVSDVEEALDVGAVFVVGEKLIFGSTVNFTNIHAWLVGSATPNFGNRPISGTGAVSASNPIRREITLECSFGVYSAYPSTKSYRVRHNNTSLDGVEWSTTSLAAFADFEEFMDENYFRLTNRNGFVFNSFGYSVNYGIRQYNKRWYNRPS